ncbi:cytochrome P450 [Fomes fomentarius]|nr:cytochrome P450 [Fomes fomentarius]
MALSLDLPLSHLTIVLLAAYAANYALCLIRWRARTRGFPLPPGPRSLPFLGNIIHMSNRPLWRANRELCKKYGDVVYLTILGQSIIALGSAEAASDLLDKRSAVTSDRQHSPLAALQVLLSGQDSIIAFMEHGLRWKRHRQMFAQQFPAKLKNAHLESQHAAAHMFLREVLADPAKLCEHMRYTFSCLMVKVIYGIKLGGKDDRIIALMESVLESVQAFSPGRFLVQYVPALQYVPYWMPVAGPQLRELEKWRADAHEESERGEESNQCILASILEKVDEKEGSALTEGYEVAKNVAITAFEGDTDTPPVQTFSALQFFFLAMSLNPEVQKKAQAELDIVVGPGRLPRHGDKASLPYVNAVVKESLRWHNAAPFSIPHNTSEDLEYRGWFIPKGTVILPPAWACLHDPEAYPDPDRFFPDRFIRDGILDPVVRDPADFAFGHGRRICPGRHFAEATLFIHVAMVLHVFKITPPVDEKGNEITIEPKATGALLLYPENCRCTIRPRSPRAEALISGAEFEPA